MIFFKVVLGWGTWTTVPALLVGTGVYTIGGGLDAIVYADVLQTFIFVTGGLTVFVLCMNEIGGLAELFQTADRFKLDNGNFVSAYRPPDVKPYPVTGMATGGIVTIIWYWIVDQEMAQRVLVPSP